MAAKFEITKTADGGYLFNLKAANGQVVLTSQPYTARASARQGIDSVIDNAADSANFDRRVAKDGSPYFVLLASNKQIVGRSEMYSSNAAMDNGIQSVMLNAPRATIVDV